MTSRLVTLAISAGLLAAAAPAVADHNSKNGEGWANMPNDIHNTRVETRDANDNEAFRDFVKNGEGSKTVNRFDTDDALPNGAARKNGIAEKAKENRRSEAMNQNKVTTRSVTRDQKRIEERSRLDSAAATAPRLSRSATSTRGSGNRGGRGRH